MAVTTISNIKNVFSLLVGVAVSTASLYIPANPIIVVNVAIPTINERRETVSNCVSAERGTGGDSVLDMHRLAQQDTAKMMEEVKNT